MTFRRSIAVLVPALLAAGTALSMADEPAAGASEDRPGGAATSKASTGNANAFSSSSGNIAFERELDFKIGNAIFRKFWVSSPSSTKTSDGLGPLYNARSCQGCHLKDGRGRPPNGNWPKDDASSMFLRLSVPPSTDEERARLAAHRVNVIAEPIYGGQLQNFAIQGQAIEGHMHITYEDVPVTLAGGELVKLRKPTYSVSEAGFGPLHPAVMMSPRVAPQMIGLGLLELVPDDQILANADETDKNADGISGRPNLVWSHEANGVKLGRFGWKAGNPTIRQQAADAFNGDMGLATTMFPRPAGDCTPAQSACLAAPNGAPSATPDVEVGDDLLRLVTTYASNLAVPPRRDARAHDVARGKDLFNAAGCALCHHPRFTTGTSEREPHLANQTIWPFTDLLLHDMGEGLADNRPEGVADGREWRTAPLWGIGLTKVVSGHTFLLHDGRARNVLEAILWHGGEAETARNAFAAMSKVDRDAMIAYVNSL